MIDYQIQAWQPDLRPLLLSFMAGDCHPLIVADWLEEQGDVRADTIREMVELAADAPFGEWFMVDMLKLFNIERCECRLMEEENGCAACQGMGWVMVRVSLK